MAPGVLAGSPVTPWVRRSRAGTFQRAPGTVSGIIRAEQLAGCELFNCGPVLPRATSPGILSHTGTASSGDYDPQKPATQPTRWSYAPGIDRGPFSASHR